MDCFDCAEQNTNAPAVGTCTDCGAGMCLQHAHAERRPVTCRITAGMAPVHHPAQQPARTLRCPSCSQVRTTITACEAHGAVRDC